VTVDRLQQTHVTAWYSLVAGEQPTYTEHTDPSQHHPPDSNPITMHRQNYNVPPANSPPLHHPVPQHVCQVKTIPMRVY